MKKATLLFAAEKAVLKRLQVNSIKFEPNFEAYLLKWRQKILDVEKLQNTISNDNIQLLSKQNLASLKIQAIKNKIDSDIKDLTYVTITV